MSTNQTSCAFYGLVWTSSTDDAASRALAGIDGCYPNSRTPTAATETLCKILRERRVEVRRIGNAFTGETEICLCIPESYCSSDRVFIVPTDLYDGTWFERMEYMSDMLWALAASAKGKDKGAKRPSVAIGWHVGVNVW